ncbi:MAG: aminoglycoside 3'-phosphotransferase, partial [Micromonosporaceae bacterium]|nr:aminoglycoside 3'-phosphotransferase [Micromonosporaceae bacterium]
MNEFGGLTFEVKDECASHFIKWFPAGQSHALRDEAARLAWAARFTPVPTVLGHGEDTAGAWMVTAALPGDNAVCDRWKADPRTAVTAIGQGLRALHDRLPVEDCPFTWAAEDRIAAVRQHARPASPAPRSWTPPGHQVLDIRETLALLEDLPP